MNILIVCGGTGGHLFPGIAVGEELLERRHQVLLVISEKEIDQRATQGARGFLIQTLPAVGWRGWRPDRMLQFAGMMWKSMKRTKQIFQDFQPQVVMGMGGFSSVAPLHAAWRRGIPSCIHESNAIPGKANRLAARFATLVAVGLESAGNQFAQFQTVWTGTPVRASLRSKGDVRKTRMELGLSADGPVVLVMGGSQGAKGLNRLATAAAAIASDNIQWIHLAGAEDEANVRAAYQGAGRKARVDAFCHEMEKMYAAADLVIARSGAASLAEIAEWNLPSILIPFPFAADRHQSANARLFHEAGAAVLIEEADCSAEKLAAEAQDILTNKNRRKSMTDATQRLRHEDSHRRLADMVERLGKGETLFA